MPMLLVLLCVISWRPFFVMTLSKAKNSFLFTVGWESYAEAYNHIIKQNDVYQAKLQVPANARIWSTNTSSYCMAPGCVIESYVSFKLSSHLNEVLTASQRFAQKILQD